MVLMWLGCNVDACCCVTMVLGMVLFMLLQSDEYVDGVCGRMQCVRQPIMMMWFMRTGDGGGGFEGLARERPFVAPLQDFGAGLQDGVGGFEGVDNGIEAGNDHGLRCRSRKRAVRPKASMSVSSRTKP